MINFDQPIVDKNRDEYILIKYSGCLKNVGEMLFNAARMQSNYKSYWLEKYPKFIEMEGKSNEDRFALLAPFTGHEFLRYMCVSSTSFGMRAIEESTRDYADLRALMNPFNASITNMEMCIRNLATYGFCKHIYIYDIAFSDVSKMFLRELLTTGKGRVSIIEGDMKSILEEKKDITSIFTDSASEVVEFIQLHGEDKSGLVEKKQFFISALPNIENPDNYGKENFYKYQKFLSEAFDRFKCGIQWWQLKYVTTFENDDNIQVKFKD